jgi:hypothetical protein
MHPTEEVTVQMAWSRPVEQVGCYLLTPNTLNHVCFACLYLLLSTASEQTTTAKLCCA